MVLQPCRSTAIRPDPERGVYHTIMAVDPKSFLSNPDPVVLFNAVAFLMRIRNQLKKICNKLPYEKFSVFD